VYALLFRLVILRLDPEAAHAAGLAAIRWGGWTARVARGVRLYPRPAPGGAVEAMGISFPGPLGLAAGLDKNASAVRGLSAIGFSHVEVGTITAKAQPGNDRPRSWRELDVRGLRNRMGFNNEGADAVARRLGRLRASRSGRRLLVGINIGKTKVTESEDAAADYAYSARLLAQYADYLVVNVSSPNTPGLRDLQATGSLRPILEATRAAADAATERHVPLLVKIAPDLANADVDAVADLATELELDGVVATNTTVMHERGPGGLSGPPVRERALEVVARLRARMGQEACIVGVGGIDTVEDAQEMLAAGATLVQGYTALVYRGPVWPARLNAALTRR